jgi:hypothetical protein
LPELSLESFCLSANLGVQLVAPRIRKEQHCHSANYQAQEKCNQGSHSYFVLNETRQTATDRCEFETVRFSIFTRVEKTNNCLHHQIGLKGRFPGLLLP